MIRGVAPVVEEPRKIQAFWGVPVQDEVPWILYPTARYPVAAEAEMVRARVAHNVRTHHCAGAKRVIEQVFERLGYEPAIALSA